MLNLVLESDAFFDNQLKHWVYPAKSPCPDSSQALFAKLREITELSTDKRWVESLGYRTLSPFWTFGVSQGQIFPCSNRRVLPAPSIAWLSQDCLRSTRGEAETLQSAGAKWRPTVAKGCPLREQPQPSRRSQEQLGKDSSEAGHSQVSLQVWKLNLLDVISLLLCCIPS